MAPLGFSTLPMEERPKPKFDDRSRSLVEQDRTLIAVNELSLSIRLATVSPRPARDGTVLDPSQLNYIFETALSRPYLAVRRDPLRSAGRRGRRGDRRR